MRKLPTGELCAGEPHAQFGGRGGRESFPTPIVGRFRPLPASRAYEASVCFSVFLLTTALSENRSSLGLLGAYIVTFTTLWDD